MDSDFKRRAFAIWCSGFFGAAFLIHLARLLLNVEVHIGSHSIPRYASVIVCTMAGLLSAYLCRIGLMEDKPEED